MRDGLRITIAGLRRTLSPCIWSVLAIGLLPIGCHAPDPQMVRIANAAADLAAFRDRAPKLDGPITLAEAQRIALEHNTEVWIAAQERDLQHELATASVLKMLPSVLANGETSRRSEYDAARSVSLEKGEESLEPSYSAEKDIRTFDIAATWNLLDFGISFFRARQQGNREAIAAERAKRVEQNLRLEVQRTFWRAVTARETWHAAKEISAEVADRLEKLRAEIATQTIAEVDGLRSETRLLEQLEELRRYKRAYLAAKAELASLLGLPPGTSFALAETGFDPPSDRQLEPAALEEQAMLHRPELFEKDLEVAITRDEAHATIARMFPSVSAFWRYDYDHNRYLAFNEWSSAGFRVSWDLLTIPHLVQHHHALNLQTDLIEKRRLAVAVAILMQLHLAIIDCHEARDQLAVRSEIADKHAALLDALSDQAQQGTSHAGEILTQRLKTLRVHAQRLDAYANLMIAEARLANTVGAPLASPAETASQETPTDVLAK